MRKQNRILITGAAGFIGFHLAKALHKRGDFVLGLDNFHPYYDVSLKRAREKYLEHLGISIVSGDICDTKLLQSIFSKEKLSHCVHLAAQAGVRHSFTNPQDYVESNLKGFSTILEALRQQPKTRFIFASSSSVYGMNQKIPFCETDKTDYPTNLYGATKKADEAMAHAYHYLYQIPMIGLRYFTVYGPWGRPDMAYFRFTENILMEKAIKVFNRGNMMRDFTYIDDIIDGTVAALDYETDFDIFNLGNHQPIGLIDLITTIETLTGKNAIKEMLPMQPGEIQQTFADINKSKKLLNFSPETSFEAGMKHFVKWYCEYHNLDQLPNVSSAFS